MFELRDLIELCAEEAVRMQEYADECEVAGAKAHVDGKHLRSHRRKANIRHKAYERGGEYDFNRSLHEFRVYNGNLYAKDMQHNSRRIGDRKIIAAEIREFDELKTAMEIAKQERLRKIQELEEAKARISEEIEACWRDYWIACRRILEHDLSYKDITEEEAWREYEAYKPSKARNEAQFDIEHLSPEEWYALAEFICE